MEPPKSGRRASSRRKRVVYKRLRGLQNHFATRCLIPANLGNLQSGPALAGGGPNAIRSIEWREFLTLLGWHGCDVAGTHEGALARDAADRLAWQVFRGFVGCRGERRLRGHTHDVSKEISHAIPGLTHKSR